MVIVLYIKDNNSMKNTVLVAKSQNKRANLGESRVMLRESFQGESSVMRLRLEGCKKPIRGHKKPIMNTH